MGKECSRFFWLLGSNIDEVGPQCGEIDIMEYRGQEPTKVLGTVHGQDILEEHQLKKL
jgi:beta-glucanase (GH16 family)